MPKRDWPDQRSCVWVVGLRHRLSAYAAHRHITDNADYAKGSSSVAIGLAHRVLIGPESLRHHAIDDGNGTQLSGQGLQIGVLLVQLLDFLLGGAFAIHVGGAEVASGEKGN